jgi:hypothetical protein
MNTDAAILNKNINLPAKIFKYVRKGMFRLQLFISVREGKMGKSKVSDSVDVFIADITK